MTLDSTECITTGLNVFGTYTVTVHLRYSDRAEHHQIATQICCAALAILPFFGHTFIGEIQGKVHGRRRRGIPMTSYSDNKVDRRKHLETIMRDRARRKHLV